MRQRPDNSGGDNSGGDNSGGDNSDSVYIAARFPIGKVPKDNSFRLPEGEKIIIGWTILQSRKSDGKPHRKAVDHFSTLPSGCIPDHDIDFFRHFIIYLMEKWLNLCDQGQKHLTKCVSRLL